MCQSYTLVEIPVDVYPTVLCYPYRGQPSCMHRIDMVRESGIDCVYSFGRTRVGGYSIVGKGHAAVVVLAKHRVYGVVALKIRRMDSKRTSLVDEAKFLEAVHLHGYAPRVHLYTDDFIVRDYVDGPTVKEFLDSVCSRSAVATLIENLLIAAHTLDKLGIDVDELSRPYKQVALHCGDPTKPLFIDLESGRHRIEPSNVTRVVNFVLYGRACSSSIRELLKLDSAGVEQLIELARLYRESRYEARRDVVSKIITLVSTNT